MLKACREATPKLKWASGNDGKIAIAFSKKAMALAGSFDDGCMVNTHGIIGHVITRISFQQLCNFRLSQFALATFQALQSAIDGLVYVGTELGDKMFLARASCAR